MTEGENANRLPEGTPPAPVEARLRDETEAAWRSAAIVEAAADAIVSATVEGIFVSWNSAAERLFGYSAEEAIGAPISIILPEDRVEERAQLIERLRRGERVEHFETVRVTKSGERIPVSMGLSPIRDAGGRLVGVAAASRDISEDKRAAAQLAARARQQEAVARLGQAALAGDDLPQLMDRAVKLATRTLKVEFGKVLELLPGGQEFLLKAGVGWQPGLVGRATVGAGPHSQAGYTLAVAEPVIVPDLRTETRFTSPPLHRDHVVISGISVVIAGPSGRAYGVLSAHSRRRREFTTDDVHFLQAVANVLAGAVHRKWAEEQQRLLIRELAHRIKNTLAVVQALAERSGEGATSVAAFLAAFRGRLGALAVAHDLATDNSWRGASLRGLAGAMLKPHLGGDRVRLEVEELALESMVAQTLALAFHELATNAGKHGALSAPGGRVTLTARAEGEVLRVSWEEAGGPPVRRPERFGFGTILLARTIEHQHGGHVELDWHEEGLVCRLSLPLAEAVGPIR